MKSATRLTKLSLGRLRRHGFLTLAAFVISGCGIAPRTETPIPTLTPTASDRINRTLIVMLPGRGDRAKSFKTAGFFAVNENSNFDVMSVDAHFAYYKERSLVTRLHDDVIVPAREKGYENIWLLGVSMGGMGALLYANQHPDIVKGIILLAPYLGDPGLSAEIAASGGLAEWSADDSPFMEHEVAIWKWLKATRAGAKRVPIYLGYGLSDRFAGNYGALENDVDALHAYTEAGGHKWKTWRRLWSRMLRDIEAEW